MVEAICRGEAPVLGTAGVDSSADLGGQHLAQLHTPLVKAVDAPDEALHCTTSYLQTNIMHKILPADFVECMHNDTSSNVTADTVEELTKSATSCCNEESCRAVRDVQVKAVGPMS